MSYDRLHAMHCSRRVYALLAVAACAVSCAGSSDRAPERARPLDCAWARDPGNCWRTFVAAVDVCLGDAAQVGTVDQDERTCRYPGGARIVSFHAKMPWPVPAGSPGAGDLHYSVSSGGRTCLDHVETRGSRAFRSVGAAGAFELEESNGRIAVHCADGSTVEGSADAVADGRCGDPAIAPVPTTEWSTSELHFQHRLAGARAIVFDCYRQRPPK